MTWLLALAIESLQRIRTSKANLREKIIEVTNTLHSLQSELLNLENEEISLDEQTVKGREMLNNIHSQASKVGESLQSIDRDMNFFIYSDHAFYEEQKSQHLKL